MPTIKLVKHPSPHVFADFSYDEKYSLSNVQIHKTVPGAAVPTLCRACLGTQAVLTGSLSLSMPAFTPCSS